MRVIVAIALAASLAVAGCDRDDPDGERAASSSGASSASTSAPSPTAQPASTTTTAPPPAGPVPKGFVAVDFTFVSADEGWLLGTAPCDAPPCTSIVHTTDGGRTWTGIPAPTAPLLVDPLTSSSKECSGDQAICVSHIRFATPQVGYVFGPALFATVDGGRNWRREARTGVAELEVAGGTAIRIVQAAPDGLCFEGCRVESTPVGRNEWRQLDGPDLRAAGSGLARQGRSTVFVGAFANPAGGADDKRATLYRSSDGGKTWQRFDDPCGDGYATTVSAAASVFAIVCGNDHDEGNGAGIVMSTDRGASFSALLSAPGSAPFGVGGPSTMSVADEHGIASSVDGGRTWPHRLAINGLDPYGVRVIGYQDEDTARAIGPPSTIWTTNDAGRTWRSYVFPS